MVGRKSPKQQTQVLAVAAVFRREVAVEEMHDVKHLVQFALWDDCDLFHIFGEGVQLAADFAKRLVGLLLDDVESCAEVNPFSASDRVVFDFFDLFFETFESVGDVVQCLFETFEL